LIREARLVKKEIRRQLKQEAEAESDKNKSPTPARSR